MVLDFENVKCENCNGIMSSSFIDTCMCIEEFICENCEHVQIFDCDDFYED